MKQQLQLLLSSSHRDSIDKELNIILNISFSGLILNGSPKKIHVGLLISVLKRIRELTLG